MIKIIGVGSPFGDDQIGLEVIRDLQLHFEIQKLIADKKIELLELDRPSISLLEKMKGADQVIIIDAMKSGQPLGTIRKFENEEIDTAECLLSTHGFGVLHTLQLGRALNQLPKNITIYGIEIDTTNPGDEIHLDVLAAKSAVNDLVGSHITR